MLLSCGGDEIDISGSCLTECLSLYFAFDVRSVVLYHPALFILSAANGAIDFGPFPTPTLLG